jgi:hypothetical protein
MKAGGDVLVNSREMPIAEEFRDVGELDECDPKRVANYAIVWNVSIEPGK